MDTTVLIVIGPILLLLMLSAFFSGSETAVTAASRPRMHQLERDEAAEVSRLQASREAQGSCSLRSCFKLAKHISATHRCTATRQPES